MFTLTITGNSPEEFIHNLRELEQSLNGPTAAVFPQPTAPFQAPAAPAAPDDEDNEPAVDRPIGALDKHGLPWDARIHSEKKGMNQDGSWRKRRSVDQVTIDTVEAELRSRVMHSPPATATPPTLPPPASPPPTAPVAPPAMPSTPPPVAAPPTLPPPVATATTPTVDFGYVMRGMQAGMTSTPPLIDQAFVAWLAGQLGISSIPEMANQPDKVAQAFDLLKQHNRWIEPA